MMEGVASEASSFAGYLRLGKLTLLYDDNHITIDGRTEITFGEDVEARYRAYGWHTVAVEDANDLTAIAAAYQAAVDEPDRPTFIRLRSHIAWGAPNAQDTSKAHGSALGEDEVRATKQAYGWDPDKHFYVPDGVYDRWRVKLPANQAARADWEQRLEAYAEAEPELAAELRAGLAGELPDGWDAELDKLFTEPKKQATRVASEECINAIARRLPTFIGGSADLAESNKTDIDRRRQHRARRGRAQPPLRHPRARHGRDHQRPGRCTAGCGRSAAPSWSSPTTCGRRAPGRLMELPVIYVWTHDSIGLGEDGPTHQPIEHLAALRAMPRLRVMRPADGPRDGRGLAGGHRPHRRPDRPGPVAPEPAPDRPGAPRRRPRACTGAPTCSPSADGGEPRLVLIATGSEVLGGPRGPRPAPGRRRPDPGGVDAVLGAVRGPGPGLPRPGAAARRPGPTGGGGRDQLRLGTAGSAPRRGRLAGTTSAPRPRRAGAGEVRLHPRQRRRPGPGPCSAGWTAEVARTEQRGRTSDDDPLAAAHRPGRRRLGRLDRPRLDPEGGAAPPARPVPGRRRHLQPDHLPEGDGGGLVLRRRHLPRLAAAGRDPAGHLRALALDDIRGRRAELEPVWERSGGVDGRVSFEVPPDIADDTEATIRETRRCSTRWPCPTS